MHNITYIISNIENSLGFEWVASYLPDNDFHISFIFLNPNEGVPLEFFLKSKNIPTFFVKYRGKKDVFSAIWKVRKQLKAWKTNIVHCHLFDANIVGLLASKLLGIKKRIYTRHHSDYHHVYFPRAVYYDRFINYLATDIVAISSAVKEILEKKEYVNPKKIHLIPHGFKLDIFSLDKNSPENLEKINNLEIKYQTQGFFPVIGVIARYTAWKGIQYIIPAVGELLKKYPKAN
jgi:glycosyltransferase involved in cell wall biosynthesis